MTDKLAKPLDFGLTDGGTIKMKDRSDAAHRDAPWQTRFR